MIHDHCVEPHPLLRLVVCVDNVAAHIDRPEVYEREIGGLEWAAARMPRAKRILVVQETPARDMPKGIEVIEAWRYLLSIPAASN